MIVRTNIYNNFFNCFNEARGIAMHKDSIISSKTNNCLSYIETKLLSFIIMIVFSLVLYVFSYFNCHYIMLSRLLYLFACLYFIATLITILKFYNRYKYQRFESSVIMDRHGITDESYYGIKMIFSWDKITGVVIGKYTITFLTNTPCYFYFSISEKERIMKILSKYKQKQKIII